MATKYVIGSSSGLWNSNTSWSTTSSAGANNTTKAVAGDAVILDAGSPAVVEIDVSNQACTSIVCTGFTGTLLFTSYNLTTTGTVTLVAGMTLTPGTATWNIGGASPTFTSAGKHFNNVNLNGSGTVTLTNVLDVDGVFYWATSMAIGTSNVNCYGLNGNGGNAFLTGTGRTINLLGGTWNHGNAAAPMQVNLTITGTVTIGDVLYGLNGTAPTLNSSGATLSFTGTFRLYYNAVLTDSTSNWATASVSSYGPGTTGTLTLSQTTTILNLSALTTGIITLASNGLIVTGNLSTTGTGSIAGQTITMTGVSGTATWSMGGTGYIGSNLTITGAVTISGNVYYRTGTINTSAATITWGTGAVFNLSASCTLTDNNADTPNWAMGSVNLWNTGSILTLSQVTTVLNLSNGPALSQGLAGNNVIVNGDVNFVAGGGCSGVVTIIMTGASGTATLLTNSSYSITANLTFLAGANTITLGANLAFAVRTLTYTSGNIVTTGCTLRIGGGAVTINTDGIVWDNVTQAGTAAVVTLGSAFTCTGLVTLGVSYGIQFLGAQLVTLGSVTIPNLSTLTLTANAVITGSLTTTGAAVINGLFTVSVGGDLALNANLSGTTLLTLDGTGTWSGAGSLNKALTINTTGTISISGTVYYGAATLTWTAGTISASGSILQINANCVIVGSVGLTLGTILFNYNTTCTIDGNMTVDGLTMLAQSQITIPAGSSLTVATNLFLDSCTLLSGTA